MFSLRFDRSILLCHNEIEFTAVCDTKCQHRMVNTHRATQTDTVILHRLLIVCQCEKRDNH